MVSPEHVDEKKFEDKQAPDPAEGQQVLPVGEKQRPWIEPLLRGIAIVLSLLIGGVCYWLVVVSQLPAIENPPSDRLAFLRMIAFLLVGLVALGGAVLFRSYWAILVVPVAICLGAFIVSTQIAMFYPTITDENSTYTVFGAAAMITWIVLPFIAVFGALIGSFVGVLWKRGWKV